MSTNASLDERSIDDWFTQEVLPLEPVLTRFLSARWYDETEISDLRQEAYLRIYEAARNKRPVLVKAFLFTIARNLMIDHIRKRNVVSIETVEEIEWLSVADAGPSPEQRVASRQELRSLQDALDALPSRCREVIILRRVQGLSQREVALKLGLNEEVIESHVARGMRLLADATSSKRGSLVAESRRFLLRRRQ